MTMWDSRDHTRSDIALTLRSQWLRSIATASKQERSREVTVLKIGNAGFTLPIQARHIDASYLARKRSGKSYTASVQAEELLFS